MARDNLPILLLGLGAAVGFWIWSRTRSGGQATSDAFDAAARIAREAESGIVEPVVEATRTVVDYLLPRGIRNNNPGNIRKGANWVGMNVDQSADPSFVVFVSPEYGIRAMTRILRTYMGRGATSIAQIISTWAPSIENATAAYIAAVSNALRYPANAPIGEAQLPALIAAIIQHENGRQPYSPDVIARGIALERTS